jgi:hypothetical protein
VTGHQQQQTIQTILDLKSNLNTAKMGLKQFETSILSTQCNLSDGFKSNTETNLKTSYLKNMDLKQ